MEKILMSGDEAIARGAWEAGVCVASAYPGTPSTEILENMAQYKDDLYCSWSNNEKTATEIAFGASLGGVRAMVSMKHVGMNVAADPIFTAAYTGVNGGLVIVSADDPGCYSSQNEQDNRLYALHARLGMLEPSDSQECLEYTKAAFELSEKFDLPMMIRVTTRVCHSKSVVQTGQRNEIKPLPYVSNPEKYAMLPANARVRHVQVEKNLEALKDYAETCALNKTIYNEGDIGIICSGICYMHAREAFGDSASYLKLAVTHPLPDKLIKAFCSKVKTVYIIEEGEPYLENAIKALGIECSGKNRLGPQGELDAQRIRAAFGLGEPPEIYPQPAQAPARPPVLCAGCPHRGFFFAMQKHKDSIVAIGDIGCYSLGVSAPFFGFEACICMGSGFSIPIGLSIALKRQGDKRKVIGILGDSTFYHSGFNSLVDAVHQMADVCLVILDNSITAMTGHQVNSGVERDLMGREVPVIPLEGMVMSAGLDKDRVRIVDPIDQQAMNAAIEAAVSTQGTFVIISRRPCALLKEEIRLRAGRHCEIDRELCRGCKACIKTACPSLAFEGKKAYIADAANCTGCGLCLQMCRFGAIKTVGG